MPHKKGHTNNPNGRPVGAQNKISVPTKEAINKLVTDYLNGVGDFYITADLAEMDAEARAKIITNLVPYVLPKQSIVGVGLDQSMKDQIHSLFPFEPPEDAGI